MYSFGAKLKELRRSRGLSQDELSEKFNQKFNAGINKGMISKWENNIVEPRLEIARQLAIFFNITLDELLGLRQIQEDEIETIAAHHEGEDWTEEELEEIERFKEFVRSKRNEHPKGK